jgi:hypothetical protein
MGEEFPCDFPANHWNSVIIFSRQSLGDHSKLRGNLQTHRDFHEPFEWIMGRELREGLNEATKPSGQRRHRLKSQIEVSFLFHMDHIQSMEF